MNSSRDASRVEPEPKFPGKSPIPKTRVIQTRTRVPEFLWKNSNFENFLAIFSPKRLSEFCIKTVVSIMNFKL